MDTSYFKSKLICIIYPHYNQYFILINLELNETEQLLYMQLMNTRGITINKQTYCIKSEYNMVKCN